ncbi:NAD-dependent malic enzyme, partial [Coxiella burnetii]
MLSCTFTTVKNPPTALETGITGKALLAIPQLNKVTAVTEEERDTLGLRWKLPNRVETLDDQVASVHL